MASSSGGSSGSGVTVVGLLGVAFVVLKLCKVITWSWWLVTLPFWGGAALAAVIVLGMLLFAGGAAAVSGRRHRR